MIGVAGGTGSGKTTFTNRLKKEFGDKITVLYHDNYYRCRDGIAFEDRKKINYDHPSALETSLLVDHIKALKKGKSVECPVYDFTKHNRLNKTLTILPQKVILVEGILVFQDEDLRNLLDIKVFVEADADERIMRRAIRDINERGRDLECVFEQYVNTVKPMHYLFVEPTKYLADIVINSGMNDIAFDLIRMKIQMLLGENC